MKVRLNFFNCTEDYLKISLPHMNGSGSSEQKMSFRLWGNVWGVFSINAEIWIISFFISKNKKLFYFINFFKEILSKSAPLLLFCNWNLSKIIHNNARNVFSGRLLQKECLPKIYEFLKQAVCNYCGYHTYAQTKLLNLLRSPRQHQRERPKFHKNKREGGGRRGSI